MSYDNSNRGAIWQNKDKQKDTQPDFKGSLDVGGVEYWVSAWKRKPDANPKAPALSFQIEPKDEAHKQGMQQAQQAAPRDGIVQNSGGKVAADFDDFSDSIPF